MSLSDLRSFLDGLDEDFFEWQEKCSMDILHSIFDPGELVDALHWVGSHIIDCMVPVVNGDCFYSVGLNHVAYAIIHLLF